MTLRRGRRCQQLVKITRLLAVVQDDLLIKVVDVVEHNSNSILDRINKIIRIQNRFHSEKNNPVNSVNPVSLPQQMRIRFEAVPHQLVNHRARRLALDALNDFAGEGVNQHLLGRVRAHAA